MLNVKIKTILKTILIVVFTTLIADKIIYWGLTQLSKTVFTGQGVGKVNHYLSIKDELELIVFGSSRANHHFNVGLLNSNGFNMGVDGRDMAYFNTLIHLLPKEKKQQVIINIDPKNLFVKAYSGEDILLLKNLYHQNEIIAERIEQVALEHPLQTVLWSLDYNGKFFSILKNSILPAYNHKNYSGYDPLVLTPTKAKIRDKVLAKAPTHDCTNHALMNPLYVKLLMETVTFCNNNNKQLILVTSPLYFEQCKNEKEQMEQFISKNKLTYWDYSEFFGKESKPAYWIDALHLSAEGATLFSSHLKQRLQ